MVNYVTFGNQTEDILSLGKDPGLPKGSHLDSHKLNTYRFE